MRKTKIDTLIKAQHRKMTPYSRETHNTATHKPLLHRFSDTLPSTMEISFLTEFISRVAGHLRITILANTI